MKFTRALWPVALISLALTTACSDSEPTPPPAPPTATQSPEPLEVADPEPTQAPEPQLTAWPLTGVATPDVADRPAIAVKIENTSAARPQSGLNEADVVWETIIEFDVSRFIAVYHSQLPGEIGPVRSVRPIDPVVVAPLSGLLVYSGGQAGVLSNVAKSATQGVSHDAGAAGLYRVKSRRAPHNVYGSLAQLRAAADKNHNAIPEQQFLFADDAAKATAVTAGTDAAKLQFKLSSAARPAWEWDSASQRWLRFEGSAAASDAAGQRLAAVNVVSVTAAHVPSPFKAQNSRNIPTYELVGEGEVTVATGGRTLTGTWRKDAVDAPLRLFTDAGDPLLLAPGNTWVELVPKGKGSLTVS